MRLIIIISIVFGGFLQAQYSVKDSLMNLEYDIYKSKSSTLQNELILKKINLLLQQPLLSESLQFEISRVQMDEIKSETIKRNFLWNASVVAYINQNTNAAKNYLEQYQRLTLDSSLNFALLNVLIKRNDDKILFNKIIDSLTTKNPEFQNLKCFFNSVEYVRPHLTRYIICSALLPGSGTALNGDGFKGFVSLSISAVSVYAIAQMLRSNLYLNTLVWGVGLGLKLYIGNINVTQKTFLEKEQAHKNKISDVCKKSIERLLNDYPIALKPL